MEKDYRPVVWYTNSGFKIELPAYKIKNVEIQPNGEVVVIAPPGKYGGIPNNQYQSIINQLNRSM